MVLSRRFGHFFDHFFENHEKGYQVFKKSPEKASLWKLEPIPSSHANFHWNPSTRKKVMAVRKMSIFFKPKILGNEGRQVRWLGHQSLDMQMIYHSSKFHWNPFSRKKVMAKNVTILGRKNVFLSWKTRFFGVRWKERKESLKNSNSAWKNTSFSVLNTFFALLTPPGLTKTRPEISCFWAPLTPLTLSLHSLPSLRHSIHSPTQPCSDVSPKMTCTQRDMRCCPDDLKFIFNAFGVFF